MISEPEPEFIDALIERLTEAATKPDTPLLLVAAETIQRLNRVNIALARQLQRSMELNAALKNERPKQ